MAALKRAEPETGRAGEPGKRRRGATTGTGLEETSQDLARVRETYVAAAELKAAKMRADFETMLREASRTGHAYARAERERSIGWKLDATQLDRVLEQLADNQRTHADAMYESLTPFDRRSTDRNRAAYARALKLGAEAQRLCAEGALAVHAAASRAANEPTLEQLAKERYDELCADSLYDLVRAEAIAMYRRDLRSDAVRARPSRLFVGTHTSGSDSEATSEEESDDEWAAFAAEIEAVVAEGRDPREAEREELEAQAGQLGSGQQRGWFRSVLDRVWYGNPSTPAPVRAVRTEVEVPTGPATLLPSKYMIAAFAAVLVATLGGYLLLHNLSSVSDDIVILKEALAVTETSAVFSNPSSPEIQAAVNAATAQSLRATEQLNEARETIQSTNVLEALQKKILIDATMGRGDPDAVREALETGVPHFASPIAAPSTELVHVSLPQLGGVEATPAAIYEAQLQSFETVFRTIIDKTAVMESSSGTISYEAALHKTLSSFSNQFNKLQELRESGLSARAGELFNEILVQVQILLPGLTAEMTSALIDGFAVLTTQKDALLKAASERAAQVSLWEELWTRLVELKTDSTLLTRNLLPATRTLMEWSTGPATSPYTWFGSIAQGQLHAHETLLAEQMAAAERLQAQGTPEWLIVRFLRAVSDTYTILFHWSIAYDSVFVTLLQYTALVGLGLQFGTLEVFQKLYPYATALPAFVVRATKSLFGYQTPLGAAADMAYVNARRWNAETGRLEPTNWALRLVDGVLQITVNPAKRMASGVFNFVKFVHRLQTGLAFVDAAQRSIRWALSWLLGELGAFYESTPLLVSVPLTIAAVGGLAVMTKAAYVRRRNLWRVLQTATLNSRLRSVVGWTVSAASWALMFGPLLVGSVRLVQMSARVLWWFDTLASPLAISYVPSLYVLNPFGYVHATVDNVLSALTTAKSWTLQFTPMENLHFLPATNQTLAHYQDVIRNNTDIARTLRTKFIELAKFLHDQGLDVEGVEAATRNFLAPGDAMLSLIHPELYALSAT